MQFAQPYTMGNFLDERQEFQRGEQVNQLNTLKIDEAKRAAADQAAMRGMSADAMTPDQLMKLGRPDLAIKKSAELLESRTTMLKGLSKMVKETVLPHVDDPAKLNEAYAKAKDMAKSLYPDMAAAIDNLPEEATKDDVNAFVANFEETIRTAPRLFQDDKGAWYVYRDGMDAPKALGITGPVKGPAPGGVKDYTTPTGQKQGYKVTDKGVELVGEPAGPAKPPSSGKSGGGKAGGGKALTAGEKKHNEEVYAARIQVKELTDSKRFNAAMPEHARLKAKALQRYIGVPDPEHEKYTKGGSGKKPLNLNDFRR